MTSRLDLDLFHTIEQQVIAERTRPSQQSCTSSTTTTSDQSSSANVATSSGSGSGGANQLTRESHPHLQVNHRHNIVSYLTSRKRRTHADLSIQSAQPLQRLYGIGYFEMKVLAVKQKSRSGSGRSGLVSVGLADLNYSNTSQPGWKRNSYGYHSDDGMKFHNSGSPLGPICAPNSTVAEVFGAGDVVGCGLNYEAKEIFYTKNGKFLGVAFTNVDLRAVYPTIGLDSASVQVFFNEDQFVFSLNVMREEAKQNMMQSILDSESDVNMENELLSLSVNNSGSSSSDKMEDDVIATASMDDIAMSSGLNGVCYQLIRQYLVHEGYLNTVLALDKQMMPHQTDQQHDKELDSLRMRSQIRTLITNGETRSALALLQQQHSLKNEIDPQILYLMHAQVFIELVSKGQVVEAAEYGRANLSVYMEREGQMFASVLAGPQTKSWLSISDVVGLLAYHDPHQSPLGHLLNKSHIQKLATSINELLVQQQQQGPSPPHLVLDRIVCHTGSLYKEVIQS